MSLTTESDRRLRLPLRSRAAGGWPAPGDADAFAKLAIRMQAGCLRDARFKLPAEADGEDCYWQAVTELYQAIGSGRRFESEEHAANTLRQRFSSRVIDLQRHIGTVTRHVVPGSNPGQRSVAETVAAPTPPPWATVSSLNDSAVLREVVADLDRDERRVILGLAHDFTGPELAERFGWKRSRYKTIARRAMYKTRRLLTAAESGERCTQLAHQVELLAAGALDESASVRARTHVRNCRACEHRLVTLRTATRDLAAVMPLSFVAVSAASADPIARLHATASQGRGRLLEMLHRSPDPDGQGTTAAAGSTLVGGGVAAKAAIALCVAGATAGGVCLGTGTAGIGPTPAQRAASLRASVAHQRMADARRARKAKLAVRARADAVVPQSNRSFDPSAQPVVTTPTASRTTRTTTAAPAQTSTKPTTSQTAGNEFSIEQAPTSPQTRAATPTATASSSSGSSSSSAPNEFGP